MVGAADDVAAVEMSDVAVVDGPFVVALLGVGVDVSLAEVVVSGLSAVSLALEQPASNAAIVIAMATVSFLSVMIAPSPA